MDKRAVVETATKRYPISPWRRLLLWWVLGPMALSSVALACVGGELGGAGIILSLIFIPPLVWWEWYTRRVQLIVSPAGLRVRWGRQELAVSWSGIERIRVDRGRECVVAIEPLEGKYAEKLAAVRGFGAYGQPLYDEEQQALLGEKRMIPLEAFAYLIQNGALLREMDTLAPSLAAEARAALERQAVDAARPASPQERRRNAVLIAILVGSLALGLFFAMSSSTGSQMFENWFFAAANAIIAPGLTLVAVVSAWNSFSGRSWLSGVLFLLFALMMILYCHQAWERIGFLLK